MKKVFKKSFLGIAILLSGGLTSCLNLTKDELTQVSEGIEELVNPLLSSPSGVSESEVVLPNTPISEDANQTNQSTNEAEETNKEEQIGDNSDSVQTPIPNQENQTPSELVDSIDLSETNKELFVGEQFELVASIYPAPLQNEVSLIWESDNVTVASVNNGVVNANNYGQAHISAKVDGNSSVVAECVVNVYNKVTAINFDSEVTLTVGGEQVINYTLTPSVGLKDSSVSYQIANTAVARVVSGKIRALKEGTTTLTIRSNQDNTISTMCNIVVNPLPPKSIDEIYDLEEDGTGYTITWLNETSEELTLPSEFNNKPVYAIDDLGFDAINIRVLRMPNSYTTINENCTCFRESEALETFVFSDNVTSIPAYFFQACYNLTKVYLPRNLEEVGDCAFDGTGITDIYFGGSENEYKYLNTNASNGNSLLLYQNPNVTVHYNASQSDL